jgi:glyoxylase-like metal-dependent hydrolase (beta-lactamase superfamily II)/predicted ester cyclase
MLKAMAVTELVRRYFDAIGAHDLDTAQGLWDPAGSGRFVGSIDLPDLAAWRRYFTELYAAFPDFRLEVLDVTDADGRAAARWRGRGTFAGPGRYQGLTPNGSIVEVEGCDVVTVAGDRIVHIDAYVDFSAVARQIRVLPQAGSRAEARLTALTNLRTKAANRFHGSEPELVADGVWLVRGGVPRTMNVYLIAHRGRITVFDAGIEAMTPAVAAAGARLGGIERVVLGHADADHRGAAPGLGVPVFCHPAEVAAAESDASERDYWDLSKLDAYARPLYPGFLRQWDGGAVQVAGTVAEGDDVAGFRVIGLPGHAPGLIGLFRESDRLALVSDCFYTIDPQSSRPKPPGVPHPAFNWDTERARASIRALAAMKPSAAWAGHAEPVLGDVERQLMQAAES